MAKSKDLYSFILKLLEEFTKIHPETYFLPDNLEVLLNDSLLNNQTKWIAKPIYGMKVLKIISLS
jgi:hypothetical protein